MIKQYKNILCIGDLHAPYYHQDTITFLNAVKKKYGPFDKVVQIGDECFSEDAEVLTPSGWKPLPLLESTDLVMQYTLSGGLELVAPLRHIKKEYTGNMIIRKHGNYYSETTENHDLVLKTPEGTIFKQKANSTTINAHCSIPRFGEHSTDIELDFTDDELKLIVAVSADFSIREDGNVYGALKKERKKKRIIELLNSLRIPYSANYDKRGYLSVLIKKCPQTAFLVKEFKHEWITKLSYEQKRLILDELGYWDGYIDPTRDRVMYCSSLKSNISFVQTLAHLCGIEASIRTVNSEFGTSYQVSILYGKKRTRNTSKVTVVPVVNLPVYCVTVPSGMLLVRQKGKITVSGNCDAHALSYHEHDPDLDSAKTELQKARKALEPIYKLFPIVDVLESNHGSLVFRKAKTAGIPSEAIKHYRDILHAPKSWNWNYDLTLETLLGPIYFHHGKSSMIDKLSKNMAMNAVQGHFHSKFYISYWASPRGLFWDMNIGCLVDTKSLAMAYGKNLLSKPILGVAIIKNGIPNLIPMVLSTAGRWTGKFLS